MSQYPYGYGYGQYHGQPPPQPPPQFSPPQYPYGYPPPGGYPAAPPPAYNPPFNPGAIDTTRHLSQGSFAYNASQIPGLGIAGAMTAPTGGGSYSLPPPPGVWSQPYQFAGGVPTAAHPSIPPPGGTFRRSFSGQHTQPPSPTGVAFPNEIPSTTAAPAAAAPPSHTGPDNEMEEGELSEGQFEDLYEPREPVREPKEPKGPKGPKESREPKELKQPREPEKSEKPLPRSNIPTLPPKPPPTTSQAQVAAAAETPDAEFYGNDEEGEVTSVDKGRTMPPRERSGSYSPFLSPREIQSEDVAPRKAESHEAISFKSLPEAKKEAQKAILRLWPLGVKYQQYIDEGIDESVVKSLFRELHLDMPKTPPESPVSGSVPPAKEAGPTNSKVGQSNGGQRQPSAGLSKGIGFDSKPAEKVPGEERKDRIARLLAAKVAKGAVAANQKPLLPRSQTQPAQADKQDSSSPSAVLPKSKTWGEKELLIQKKIAALQKSREAHGQKPENDKTEPGVDKGHVSGESPSIPTGPRKSNQNRAALSSSLGSAPSPEKSSIPGLLLSSSAQPIQPANQRKRPVASDFVDFTPTTAPVKRPFGQDRKHLSLVIDVSDGSDDEEMDLDSESPIAESWPIQTTGTPIPRGPSIRDFPPPSDSVQSRQFSNPAPSHTPPGVLAIGKKRESELNLKERQIQEMKRKIAEAEAKKRIRNPSVGSSTPNHSGQTPELRDRDASRPLPKEDAMSRGSSDPAHGPSAQLISEERSARFTKSPELLRLAPQERTLRRGRIVSLDLPRIEETLEEKMYRLRQVQEEGARLQAEIDRDLAEKKLLTEELEQLEVTPEGDTPEGDTPQSNGLGSSHNLAPASAAESRPSDAQTPTPSATSSSVSDQSEETNDVPMDEDESSRDSSRRPSLSEEASQLQPSITGFSEGTNITLNNADATTQGPGGNGLDSPGTKVLAAETKSLSPQKGTEDPLTAGGAVTEVAITDVSPVDVPEPETASPALDEQPGLSSLDDTAPMELESPSPSSSPILKPTNPAATHNVSEDNVQETAQQPASLDQISSVANPREDLQEIEADVTREVHVSVPKQERTFMPYDSPLRYFHGYRFHSGYRNSVAGGLKSLTYSNKIDPNVPFCPYELGGNQCPENCQFQHYRSINVADDQILLELGKADEYSGEQKSRFIQGLRDLLQNFRTNKVKDFDTIARGIIEFRTNFLGDKSKVLNLEGVNL
ncbi:hypothetical protein B0T24DRAFT_652237 [Lasiosphaeria ovina]|uniref:Zinc-finger domain-containing protein n=1 Tax=Lasiosphaeria ovina TaxID=92902 RepID=A0AAE0MZG0_9PEZI|nr:hypothetical protein B0T24DRAFT_652237 [Lasiosphaeria ovina]